MFLVSIRGLIKYGATTYTAMPWETAATEALLLLKTLHGGGAFKWLQMKLRKLFVSHKNHKKYT